MLPPPLTIRPMSRSEINLAVEWAAAEGWNPGLHDAESFHAADPTGFLIGCLDHEPVSVISAVKYGESFGFLGFYIVKPTHRGQGHGWKIWQAALTSLSGRTIGLDGVVAQQENYRKSGFTLAYRNIRFQGIGGISTSVDSRIMPLSDLPFEEIAAYDQSFFPADRTAFLRSWLAQPGSVGLGIRNGNGLAGYGVVRPCRSGYKIGPLFADTPALAEALFLALRSHVPAHAAILPRYPGAESSRLGTGPAPRHDLGL